VNRRAKNATVTALLGVLFFLTACERTTHVKIEGGDTPTFALSGSGRLAGFTIYTPDFAERAKSPWDKDFALWEIELRGDRLSALTLGELGQIKYGMVPKGYEQRKPSIGSAPLLKEGEKYFYEVDTNNAPGASGYIEIRNSRAVATEGAYPCFGGEGKKWVRVPCPH
jgi:hypothetical protein